MAGFRSEDEIGNLVRRFSERTLPKSEWTHAAHWAVAIWLLGRHGPEAAREMPPLIRAYNESTGVANTPTSGYHETITLASLRAALSWLNDRPGVPQYLVLNEMLGTTLGRSDWLLRHWSKEALFAPTARFAWVEPDLAPLPYSALRAAD